MDVTGVDPAGASLDVARARPGAERVRWLHGDATGLPELQVDLATMTANVAHVFLTDEDWAATLRGVYTALRPGGYLVFEVRDPARRPWERWTRENTYRRFDVPGTGVVETWWDETEVDGALVSYRRTYVFAVDGTTLTSDSTRRFWTRAEIEDSLGSAGYALAEARDAPDRPGREWVFTARKP
jgi:SAM-dependent methyltransferase